jgi:hypothetical protein
MNETEKFEEACREPVDLDDCYKALQLLVNGEHNLHVPPQIDDADILISRALRELKEHRKYEAEREKYS